MVRRVRLVLLVVSLVVLQTTVFTHLRVFGAVPSLCLVATVAIAYEEGPERGALFGFLSGLFLDLFLSSPLGLSALSQAVVGYGVGAFQGAMLRESKTMPAVLSAVGGLLGGAIFALVGAVAGEPGYLTGTSLRVIVVAALYDAVVALPVFAFTRWANHDPDIGYSRRR
ncbi:MAG: rod shape-determining protein MreD [Acidimicrobiia bacterium]|jgi:rod shape-determining protein MreD